MKVLHVGMACLSMLTGAALASGPAGAREQDARKQLLQATCQAIESRVAAIPGDGPVMLASYEPAPGGEPLASALQGSAFVYDNALAGIALLACGHVGAARRIADGMTDALTHDRYYHDGRLRNAYRAGAVPDGPIPLPGWWDAPSKSWFEDAYQVSTATGNVAWAALMLLAVGDATRDHRYTDAAASMMAWVDKATFDARAPAGYIGGFFGEENALRRQGWKSTEHNTDAYAAYAWLERRDGRPKWKTAADRALGFVQAMWRPAEGRFIIGTDPDGHTPNSGPSALDADIWPLIVFPDAMDKWGRALDWMRAHHAVDGGYGFKGEPDGIWTEGTGQAALVLCATGHCDQAKPLWPLLLAQRSPSGLLYATPRARIRTGLSIGPDSKGEDFFYYHLPHLGATAWAALAAAGRNPFQPKEN
jgi:hypothetical protein